MVVIWNMSPVRSKSDEANTSVPKILCELTNHLSCVNSVRWSLDGKWLASGGDDAIVMIWQIKHQGSAAFSSTFGGSPTHEQWGCVHMLRGHSSNVLDLSWSPNRRYLASCSVDNTIVIWNARDLPQKVTVIDGHQGLVKGLSWDPVGKFIASQSDDRSIRIWRTSDWKEAKTITEPFRMCSGTTHVLRLSWSPDGRYIVSAHSLNNDGPTAQIIERGAEWRMGMDFVGHRKAVEVVAFNPHLFVRSGGKENHGCVALGSKDRSLSIWLTNHKRPLAVVHDLFKDSILDLSWSVDGYELLVCSTDGSIAYLSFSSKELGQRLSRQALDDLYLRTYGFRRAEVKSADTSMVLIENPEMLKLHSSSTPIKDTPLHHHHIGADAALLSQTPLGLTSTSSKGPPSSSSSLIKKQVETRTKDGKRRITPITLTTEPCPVSQTPLPFTSFSPKQNKGAVIQQTTPEREGASSSKKSTSGSEHSTPKSCPEFVGGGTPPKASSFEALSPKTIQTPLAVGVAKQAKAAPPVAKGSRKRPQEEDPSAVQVLPKAKKLKRRGAQLGGVTAGGTQSPRPGTPQKQSTLHSAASASRHASTFLLPPPKLESHLSVVLVGVVSDSHRGEDSAEVPVVEVENDLDTAQCKLSYTQGSAKLWEVSLSSPCLQVAATSEVTCAACQDHTLSIYSTHTGRLLSARLLLSETCCCLKVESWFVMAALRSGQLTVWDARKMAVVVRNASFSHLLKSSKQGPDEYLLSKDGLPVLRAGPNCFVFNSDMHCWMELASSAEASEIHRSVVSSSSSQAGSQVRRSLSFLQDCVLSDDSQRRDSVGLMLQQAHLNAASSPSTLAYLEAQISRCACVGTFVEHRHWGNSYVQYLVKNNMEDRLREFCGKFSEPPSRRGSELVMGFSKEETLREYLAIIAKNPKLQRLHSEFKEAMGKT